MGGEEPARAEERAPRGHRGQPPRVQLGAVAERVRRALHGAEPGRAAPWSTVEDVTFVNNVVRRTASGINILGCDDCGRARARGASRSGTTCSRTSAARAGAAAAVFQILNGPSHLVIEHNTALQTGSIIVAEGPPQNGFVFRHNIVPHNAYGIIGTGTGPGTGTVEKYFPGAVIEGNVIAGGESSRYPRGNHFPGTLLEVRFADQPGGNYRLAMEPLPQGRGQGGGRRCHGSSPPARSTWGSRGPR